VPTSPIETTRNLGAGGSTIFWPIVLPGIVAGAALRRFYLTLYFRLSL